MPAARTPRGPMRHDGVHGFPALADDDRVGELLEGDRIDHRHAAQHDQWELVAPVPGEHGETRGPQHPEHVEVGVLEGDRDRDHVHRIRMRRPVQEGATLAPERVGERKQDVDLAIEEVFGQALPAEVGDAPRERIGVQQGDGGPPGPRVEWRPCLNQRPPIAELLAACRNGSGASHEIRSGTVKERYPRRIYPPWETLSMDRIQ